MELIDALAALWRRKLLVLLGIVVAGVAGILTIYNVRFSSPFLVKKSSISYGVASSQLLVDFQRSTVSDATQDDTALVTRAATYSGLLGSTQVMRDILRTAHLGNQALLSVTGPYAVNEPRAQTQAPANQRAFQVASEVDNYTLEVSNAAGSPVISLYEQGPNAAAALRLANAVPVAFRQFLKSMTPSKRHVVASRLVTVRDLGAPVAKTIGGSSVRTLAGAGVGVGVFVLWCLVVLGGMRLAEVIRLRRETRAREYSWDEEFAADTTHSDDKWDADAAERDVQAARKLLSGSG
jgi:capsular polysaccharide biosynthesis protein